MEHKCKDCGICCLNTDMILSEQDINLILNNYSSINLKREDFVVKNRNGYFQLKNIETHCVFFNILTKTCKIYFIRPQGCRFYPLIYDNDKNKCVLDDDCPRIHLFYQNINKAERTCKKIEKFLKEQLFLNI